jgi:hypothetical protein
MRQESIGLIDPVDRNIPPGRWVLTFDQTIQQSPL